MDKGFEPATFSSFHHSALPLSYVVIPLASYAINDI